MDCALSSKSQMGRLDAACGVAIICREICESIGIASFSNAVAGIPDRHGFALRDAILVSQDHGGTALGEAVKFINTHYAYERLIVITDEQSSDRVPAPKGRGYVINVSTEKNGIGYSAWTHIDGFSEAVIKWIMKYENSNLNLG